MTPGRALRSHARDAVRDEVVRRAWELFAEQGFDATTIDAIAEASGMSRRSFFRYFSGKDELVLQRMLEADQEIVAVLGSRPPDEPAWPALRAALEPSVRLQQEHADRSRPLLLMLRDEPALRASVEERRRRWRTALAPLVAARLGARSGGGPDPRPVAVASSALACFEAAQEQWAENPTCDLGALLDVAMSVVTPLG